MVQNFKIPWGAWNEEDENHLLVFPDSWQVQTFEMQNSKEIINTKDIKNTLNNPINSATIRELANNKNTAVIVVEDISRPTNCAPICEIIVEDLNTAGIIDDNITIIGAIGAHRPMNRKDYIKKVGINMVERLNIENHHPYENLVNLGQSERGTPIDINKTYYNADIKISLSTVIPHPLAGFGGGAKIILPGICGIKTLAANHKAALQGKGIGLGFITETRKDIEEVCTRVGLDFSVNIITTKNRGIAGIFAGHFIDAHRKSIELAKKVYSTKLPKLEEHNRFDVGFFNLFPEDTELTQSSKGTNIFMQAENIFKKNAILAFLTASYEGRGFHSLLSETGSLLYEDWKEAAEMILKLFEEKTFMLYSPHLTKSDVTHFWSEDMVFHNCFNDLLQNIEEIVGNTPKVAIFPTSIQLLK